MSQRFLNQAILITGAASGIGRATAWQMLREGGKVVAADIDETGLKGLEMEVRAARDADKHSGQLLTHRLDVTSPDDWKTAVQFVTTQFGALSVLVNCAGVGLVKSVVKTSLAEWRRIMSINLDGVFLGTQAAIAAMRKTGGGAIVNVASASGLKSAPYAGAYCASKAGVIAFTKAAALECAKDAAPIRINAVCPGGVKTPLWHTTPGAEIFTQAPEWQAPADAPPGSRFALPDEIAAAIAFAASREASFMTGSVFTIDGGYTAG